MKSSNDRYIIVYNGEVYNFLDIKNKLLDCNYKFRSKSDTEVILNSFHMEISASQCLMVCFQ